IVPLVVSTTPAVPTPRPLTVTGPVSSVVVPSGAVRTPPWATTSRTRPATASSTASGPAVAGVGTERTGPTAPSARTRAAAVFVPPRSTPTTTSLTCAPLSWSRDIRLSARGLGPLRGRPDRLVVRRG